MPSKDREELVDGRRGYLSALGGAVVAHRGVPAQVSAVERGNLP